MIIMIWSPPIHVLLNMLKFVANIFFAPTLRQELFKPVQNKQLFSVLTQPIEIFTHYRVMLESDNRQ